MKVTAGFAIFHLWLIAMRIEARGKLDERKLDLSSLIKEPDNAAGEKADFLKTDGHYGGYFSIDGGSEKGHLFYFYFENRYRDPHAPLVLWSNGGPGCSSLYGLFLENGPYCIEEDLTLSWNPYGWDIGQNIIFVEYPFGVGYSIGSRVKTEKQVADIMLQFIYEFYKAHPEASQKQLFLAGESFAGHYLPVIATKIIGANEKRWNQIKIPLAGVALGDAWTNPSLQFRSYSTYAYQMGLMSKEERDAQLRDWEFCDYDLKLCTADGREETEKICEVGYSFCNELLFEPILFQHPGINYYDIRADCPVDGCYDVSLLIAFMNQTTVKEHFHISPGLEWSDCSNSVYFDMLWDCGTDRTGWIEDLLEKSLPILFYVGDQDLICNYVGVRDFVDALEWNGTREWNEQSDEIWTVKEKHVGEVKKTALLSYLKIYECGHMAPTDQPEVALEMIQIFTNRSRDWKTVHRTETSLSRDKSFYPA